jgi:hypothetical protein
MLSEPINDELTLCVICVSAIPYSNRPYGKSGPLLILPLTGIPFKTVQRPCIQVANQCMVWNKRNILFPGNANLARDRSFSVDCRSLAFAV